MSAYNDEIDIKQLGRRMLDVARSKKKTLTSLLIILALLSLTLFAKVVFIPTYKASYILKSKFVRYDQINKTIDKYNYYIDDPDLTPLSDTIAYYVDDIKLKDVVITEIENNADVLVKEDEQKFNLYDISFLFKKHTRYIDFEKFNNLILKDIKESCATDNQIVETKIKLQNGIQEIDSLIKTANEAGVSYTKTLSSGSGGQLMVMNDLYTGINSLINQKLNYQQGLALLETENLIFKTSPLIVSNKIEYPWVIFLIAFGIWVFISIAYIFLSVVFGDGNA